MSESFHTLEQVADRLGLHVRTVRAYVRDGRLKATRIGKQYRVTQADLDALTGQTRSLAETRRTRHVDVTSIVEIDAVAPDLAMRMSNGLVALGQSTSAMPGPPMRVQASYDETRAVLKLIVTGDLEAAKHILKLIALYLEP